MVFKGISAAILALFFGMGAAYAQSSKDFGGPRELPPASYKGQQYVDSRGCVFLRAGFGGQTNWVPRVSRDRRQLCGYPPSGRAVAVADGNAPPVAVVPPVRKPIDTVASIRTPPRIRANETPPVVAPAYAPPAAQAVPRAQGGVRVPTVPGAGKIGCYPDVPVAERFAVRGGGTIVMCTRGDGDLTNARAPRLAGGKAAVAPSGFVEGSNRSGAAPGRLVLSTQDATPEGYKKAWNDDRLNPRRGQGTERGWYDQDGVWTREIPARLVEDAARAKGKSIFRRQVVPRGDQARLQASSKSEPAAGRVGRSYVQVGTFGQAANAKGASSRLAGLGLPVARQSITKSGKALAIVLAGPFASIAEAQAALRAARGAGFKDAFIR